MFLRLAFILALSGLATDFLAVGAAHIRTQNDQRLGLVKLRTSEHRIRAHGYPAETHQVEDSGGYLLTLFRLPYSHKLANEQQYRPAILLQHGLFSNSDCWLGSGPDNSLAYLLVDAGYDVWLGNARGNIYSRDNNKISKNHPHYWRFSWHEIGTSSVAAMIDYIIETTGQQKIHYVGHSQGTTVYFVLMSEHPEYNAKVKSAHMLAPCAFFEHGKSFVFNLFDPLVGNPESTTNKLLMDIELLPRNPIISRIVDTSCGTLSSSILHKQCKNLYLWVMGGPSESTNQTAVHQLVDTHPGGAASNQGIHYIQLYRSHEFRQFDWGVKRNKIVYNDTKLPEYNLSLIKAATHFYSSANDRLCVPADVNTLVSRFPHLTEDYRMPDPNFTHFDFISSKYVKELLNVPLIERLQKYEEGSV